MTTKEETVGDTFDLDATMHETEEELKIPVTDLKLEDVRRKIIRCRVCNRQRFAHPGGIQKFGLGKCDSLDILELNSVELINDDERVDVERTKRRGTKRNAEYDDDNSETKKMKESSNVKGVPKKMVI